MNAFFSIFSKRTLVRGGMASFVAGLVFISAAQAEVCFLPQADSCSSFSRLTDSSDPNVCPPGYSDTEPSCDKGQKVEQTNGCYKCVDETSKDCPDGGKFDEELTTCPEGQVKVEAGKTYYGETQCYKCVNDVCPSPYKLKSEIECSSTYYPKEAEGVKTPGGAPCYSCARCPAGEYHESAPDDTQCLHYEKPNNSIPCYMKHDTSWAKSDRSCPDGMRLNPCIEGEETQVGGAVRNLCGKLCYKCDANDPCLAYPGTKRTPCVEGETLKETIELNGETCYRCIPDLSEPEYAEVNDENIWQCQLDLRTLALSAEDAKQSDYMLNDDIRYKDGPLFKRFYAIKDIRDPLELTDKEARKTLRHAYSNIRFGDALTEMKGWMKMEQVGIIRSDDPDGKNKGLARYLVFLRKQFPSDYADLISYGQLYTIDNSRLDCGDTSANFMYYDYLKDYDNTEYGPPLLLGLTSHCRPLRFFLDRPFYSGCDYDYHIIDRTVSLNDNGNPDSDYSSGVDKRRYVILPIGCTYGNEEYLGGKLGAHCDDCDIPVCPDGMTDMGGYCTQGSSTERYSKVCACKPNEVKKCGYCQCISDVAGRHTGRINGRGVFKIDGTKEGDGHYGDCGCIGGTRTDLYNEACRTDDGKGKIRCVCPPWQKWDPDAPRDPGEDAEADKRGKCVDRDIERVVVTINSIDVGKIETTMGNAGTDGCHTELCYDKSKKCCAKGLIQYKYSDISLSGTAALQSGKKALTDLDVYIGFTDEDYYYYSDAPRLVEKKLTNKNYSIVSEYGCRIAKGETSCTLAPRKQGKVWVAMRKDANEPKKFYDIRNLPSGMLGIVDRGNDIIFPIGYPRTHARVEYNENKKDEEYYVQVAYERDLYKRSWYNGYADALRVAASVVREGNEYGDDSRKITSDDACVNAIDWGVPVGQ